MLSCPQYTEEISPVVLWFELNEQGADPANSLVFCIRSWYAVSLLTQWVKGGIC